MSDLVKKVCDALAGCDDDPEWFVDDARRAIKAVAEWLLSNADDHETVQTAYLLERQSKEGSE